MFNSGIHHGSILASITGVFGFVVDRRRLRFGLRTHSGLHRPMSGPQCENRTRTIALALHQTSRSLQKTEGYSGSDIRLVAKEAAMMPVRKIFDALENHTEGARCIRQFLPDFLRNGRSLSHWMRCALWSCTNHWASYRPRYNTVICAGTQHTWSASSWSEQRRVQGRRGGADPPASMVGLDWNFETMKH